MSCWVARLGECDASTVSTTKRTGKVVEYGASAPTSSTGSSRSPAPRRPGPCSRLEPRRSPAPRATGAPMPRSAAFAVTVPLQGQADDEEHGHDLAESRRNRRGSAPMLRWRPRAQGATSTTSSSFGGATRCSARGRTARGSGCTIAGSSAATSTACGRASTRGSSTQLRHAVEPALREGARPELVRPAVGPVTARARRSSARGTPRA